VWNGTRYFYVTNQQGDVTAILNNAGTPVAAYTYDAWGNILTATGSMADTLGKYNPLRYRGYVYDQEYEFYYLQSRYYNPETSRFLNADALTSTGQGILGNNMFAYCQNNPVMFIDPDGLCRVIGPNLVKVIDCGEIDCKMSKSYVEGDFSEELAVLRGETKTYKDVKVHKIMPGNAGFSLGSIFLPRNADDTIADVMHLRHEYGHTVQLDKMGVVAYVGLVVSPSVTFYAIDELTDIDISYYSLPWEFEADRLGGVTRRSYNPSYFDEYMTYRAGVSWATGNCLDFPVAVFQ